MRVVWDGVTCIAHEGVTFNYRGTAPIVLALLAVCSDDVSNRLLERFDARELMVRRIR